MDFDTYLDRQIDKHTREVKYYSDCCHTEMLEDECKCEACGEYCLTIDEHELHEIHLEEIGDQKRQQQKDE